MTHEKKQILLIRQLRHVVAFIFVKCNFMSDFNDSGDHLKVIHPGIKKCFVCRILIFLQLSI